MEDHTTKADTLTWVQSKSKSSTTKPWGALVSLTAIALFMGILVAVTHHLFYHFLDGKQVDVVLPQAWAIIIATAMAFLCKTFLVLAAGTAFVQVMFNQLRHKSLRVKEVDSMSQMLRVPFELFFLNLWSKVPFACLIAVTVWLIPVAVIFPPGTLSVSSLNSTFIQNEKIAALDFANDTQYITTSGSVANRAYSDASASVYKAALASSTTGQVLSVPHSHVNMSYDALFYGPALQCGNASPELNTTAGNNLLGAGGSDADFLWVSFVGGDDRGVFNTTPCDNVTSQYDNTTFCENDNLPLTWFNDTINFVTLDTTSTDAARLYVWTLGNVWSGGNSTSNLLECKLKNASYAVAFEFGVNQQTTTLSKLDFINDVAAENPYNTTLPQTGCPDAADNPGVTCLAPNPVQSYQGVMQAFNSLLVGAIYGSNLGQSRTLTLVQATTLAQNYDYDAPDNDHIATDVESLFQNVTISMLNFPDLRADETSTSAVPVTVREVHATYQYRPRNLYLAYGLSILATILCGLVGLMARHNNGGSYTSKFSTFTRFAVSAGLLDSISSDDSGADPCPLDLRETMVRLDREQLSEG